MDARQGARPPRGTADTYVNWSTASSRKRAKRRPRGQPTEKQATEERARVPKETPLLTQNSFEALRIQLEEGSESDSFSSNSTLTEALKGPELTPRTAVTL
ncbi:hypothetical protein NDU88_003822 [Pleurodeles waltl]|uniref:Uncharacterized protein n=1 Tax=Pleurodeles waltl TaxID=8319 RepID=A0AAV7WTJ3_PLEWA|nr:hypothetical protein NDU88_003822 [Pleurodeles waltl]